MGTHIEAACVLTRGGLRKATARGLADAAARACLAQAGRQPGDVDMLINAGIYREDNMGEPALAALIQEDIGANRGEPPVGGHGTFSFDLLNGTCGVITAIQLESGLLRSGVIRLGAIVTSDVDPDAGSHGAAAPRPAGGAILLGWDDNIAGFTDFHFETFPEYADLYTAGLMWQGRRGIRFPPSAPGFLDPLRERLGVPGDRVAYTPEDLEGTHTTGPIAAVQAAIRSGRLGEAGNTLMLAAGSGITVALALYRQTPA